MVLFLFCRKLVTTPRWRPRKMEGGFCFLLFKFNLHLLVMQMSKVIWVSLVLIYIMGKFKKKKKISGSCSVATYRDCGDENRKTSLAVDVWSSQGLYLRKCETWRRSSCLYNTITEEVPADHLLSVFLLLFLAAPSIFYLQCHHFLLNVWFTSSIFLLLGSDFSMFYTFKKTTVHKND